MKHPLDQTKEKAESKDHSKYATLVQSRNGKHAYCVLINNYWWHCNLYDNHKPIKKFCHKDNAVEWRGLTGFDY